MRFSSVLLAALSAVAVTAVPLEAAGTVEASGAMDASDAVEAADAMGATPAMEASSAVEAASATEAGRAAEAAAAMEAAEAGLVLHLPPWVLDHAATILDRLDRRIVELGSDINNTISLTPGNITVVQAIKLGHNLEAPLEMMYHLLIRASMAVEAIGLEITGSNWHSSSDAEPECDAYCLIGKATKIVHDVAAMSNHIADKLGIHRIAHKIEPVVKAAEDLIHSLSHTLTGPDEPVEECHRVSSGIRRHIRDKFHSIMSHVLRSIMRRLLRSALQHLEDYEC